MLSIQTNILSSQVQGHLAVSSAQTKRGLEQLSTGKRINSARDDAAGLAISERFKSQIAGLGVARRNSADSASLLKTAEGVITGMTALVQRVRELAVQSANATYNSLDRAALQSEVKQLISEFDRQAGSASFNGLRLLDGSFGTKSFQIGANVGESLGIALEDLRSSSLGMYHYESSGFRTIEAAVVSNVVTASGVLLGEVSTPNETLALAGNNVGAQVLTVSGPAGNADIDAAQSVTIARGDSAKSISASLSSLDGVTTLVNATEAKINGITNSEFGLDENDLLRFNLNGQAIESRVGADSTVTRSNLTAAISSAFAGTGLSVADNGDGSIGLVAADGANIEFTDVSSQNNATLKINGVTSGADDNSIFGTVDGIGFAFDGSGTEASALDNLTRALNFRLGTGSADAVITVSGVDTSADDTVVSISVDGTIVTFDGSDTALADRLDKLYQSLQSTLVTGGPKLHQITRSGIDVVITRLDGQDMTLSNLTGSGAGNAGISFDETDGVTVVDLTEGVSSTTASTISGSGGYWIDQNAGAGGAVTLTRRDGGNMSLADFQGSGAGNAGLTIADGAGTRGTQSLNEGGTVSTTAAPANNTLLIKSFSSGADDNLISLTIDGNPISFDGSSGDALDAFYQAAVSVLGASGTNTHEVSQLNGAGSGVMIIRTDGALLSATAFTGSGAATLTADVLSSSGAVTLNELSNDATQGGPSLMRLSLQGVRGPASTLVEGWKDSAAVAGSFDLFLESELSIASNLDGSIDEGTVEITGILSAADDANVTLFIDDNKIEFVGVDTANNLDRLYAAAQTIIGSEGIDTHLVSQPAGSGTPIQITRKDGFDMVLRDLAGSGVGSVTLQMSGLNNATGVTDLLEGAGTAITAVPKRANEGLFNSSANASVKLASTATQSTLISFDQLTTAGEVISLKIDAVPVTFTVGTDRESSLNAMLAALQSKQGEFDALNLAFRKFAGQLELRSNDADPINLSDFSNSGSNSRGLLLTSVDDTVALAPGVVTNLVPGAIIQSRSSGTEGISEGNYVGPQELYIAGQTPTTITIPSNSDAKTVSDLVNQTSNSTGVKSTASTTAYLESLSGAGTISFNLFGSNSTAILIQASLASTSLAELESIVNAQTSNTGISAEFISETNALKLVQPDGFDIKIEDFEHNSAVTDVDLNDGVDSASIQSIRVRGEELPSSFVTLFDGRAISDSQDQDSTVVGGKLTFESCFSMSSSLAGGEGSLFNVGANEEAVANPEYLFSGIELSSQESALIAIKVADCTIDQLTSARARVGATLNRLDSISNTILVARENLSAARSRIVDTDFAAASAELAKNQIIQQSSMAMIAQANAVPKMVLSLLKGFQ